MPYNLAFKTRHGQANLFAYFILFLIFNLRLTTVIKLVHELAKAHCWFYYGIKIIFQSSAYNILNELFIISFSDFI